MRGFMSFNIPTKKDFLSLATCEQAREALFLYVREYVFPHTFAGEDDCSLFELAFFENNFSLESFWSRYGEIGQYPNEFRQFCWQIVKENKSQTSGDELDLVRWSINTTLDKCIYYKKEKDEENAGCGYTNRRNEDWVGDKDPLSIMLANENNGVEKKGETISFEKCLNQLNALQQKQVYVFYLSALNFILVNASNAPSDMPEAAQELLRTKTRRREEKYGAQLNYATKLAVLEKSYPLYFEGICPWAMGYEKKHYPHIHDEKTRQRLYKQLYKEVGFHKTNFNSSRFHTKLADLFIQCLIKVRKDFAEDDSFIQKLKKKRPPLQLELKPLPTAAYTAKDKMYCALAKNMHVCEEYESIMLWLLRNELDRRTQHPFVIPVEKINQYLVHKSQCAQCKQTEEAMREVMAYRYGRLQEIMNKPIYPIHSPNNGQISGANTKGLVRYYTERYHKIPCELHKYYLALAYKQNGDLDKSKTLLASNKTGAPAENLTMGTVLSVYCACGKEDEYHLNALRSPKIAIGRLDKEDPLDIPQINVCQPDGLAMSRDMLTLEYQANRQDWLVHPKQEQAGNLWFLAQDKLFDLLERQMGKTEDLYVDYAESFEPLTQDVWLSDIAGIGMFWKGTVSFEGKLLQGVTHPLLGRLPVGWYIEVKAHRRNKTIMKSFADKSFVE